MFRGRLTPLKSEIFNATLYLSTFFDLKYDFDKVQIPQLLDWVNPWDAPSARVLRKLLMQQTGQLQASQVQL